MQRQVNKATIVSNDASIQLGVSLQPYNTLAIPAKAAYLSRCTSIEQLISCLEFAQKKSLPLLVLGEGSNIVFSKDFEGLVVLNRLTGIELVSQESDRVIVKVAAGENWHDFVRHSLEQGWFGLQNLALIPGLVGAAPIQNIGAYGVEVKDTITTVETLDIVSKELHTLNTADCQFAYRDSVFKQVLANKRVITSVTFALSKVANLNLSYPALAACFDYAPSPLDVFNAVCQIRAAKLPMPEDIPNAGSFFKNPIVDQDQYLKLQFDFPEIVAFPLQEGGAKLAAGWLIEQRGWKDKSLDAVYIHRHQALVIVNPNFKMGDSVLKLAAAIQADIESVYGVILEIEPRIY
ncbi:MAG: UDP-N-acetylmuramate dehydrogenase [Arenicella sp.]|jgi:UDP-N-acetylmuramate dehydrogenase